VTWFKIIDLISDSSQPTPIVSKMKTGLHAADNYVLLTPCLTRCLDMASFMWS